MTVLDDDVDALFEEPAAVPCCPPNPGYSALIGTLLARGRCTRAPLTGAAPPLWDLATPSVAAYKAWLAWHTWAVGTDGHGNPNLSYTAWCEMRQLLSAAPCPPPVTAKRAGPAPLDLPASIARYGARLAAEPDNAFESLRGAWLAAYRVTGAAAHPRDLTVPRGDVLAAITRTWLSVLFDAAVIRGFTPAGVVSQCGSFARGTDACPAPRVKSFDVPLPPGAVRCYVGRALPIQGDAAHALAFMPTDEVRCEESAHGTTRKTRPPRGELRMALPPCAAPTEEAVDAPAEIRASQRGAFGGVFVSADCLANLDT